MIADDEHMFTDDALTTKSFLFCMRLKTMELSGKDEKDPELGPEQQQ